MSPRVVITGLGAVSGLGIGIEPLWAGVCGGSSAIGRVQAFDPSGFQCQVAAEVREFDVKQFVPKSYRKATKVMARDIELAVAAADQAVRHANLTTPGIDAAAARSYDGARTGCHIGAGLIAADIEELTDAMVAAARDDQGGFDIHKWGSEGMNHLTPLWLLKYLPNMLACHVTIIHDAQGPSNTITCGEASSGLSIGESLRVIQRGAADMCYCGGAESKINPMAFYRQELMGRLSSDANEDPVRAVRPFDQTAAGTALGEGGGILTLERVETAQQRGAKIWAELVGFGASHTVNPKSNGMEPDAEGRGIAAAVRSALRDAKLTADDIDLIVPTGLGIAAFDAAEAAGLRAVFGPRIEEVPLWSSKPYIGTCGAGAGALDVALAAKMLDEQKTPGRINCDRPIASLNAANSACRETTLNHVLVFSTSLGGQNVALILRRAE